MDVEVDHVVSRAAGGRDDIENLQLLSLACHRGKTTYEALSFIEDVNPLLSRSARRATQASMDSQTPPQAVSDFMDAQAAVLSIDIRRFIFKWGHTLADYSWIEIVPTPWRNSTLGFFPYFGAGWHGAATAAYLLDTGISLWSDFKLQFNASVHREPSYLAERLRTLDELWCRSGANLDPDLFAKRALLAMIGTWGSRERCCSHLITSSTPLDVPARNYYVCETRGAPDEDDVPVYHDSVFKQKILDLSSLRPLHQICLEAECLNLVRAKQ
jgi:hypothetical protein